tara:strand:+ start:83 stop:349 length:267 start_codon:yes stop_codon:yes gene_type:complete
VKKLNYKLGDWSPYKKRKELNRMLKFIMQLWIVTFMSIAFIIIAMALGGKDQQYIIDGAMFVTVILIASNIIIDTVLLGLHIIFKERD